MTSARGRLRVRSLVQVADYPPGATFGPRRLGDYEFVWLLSGSAVLHSRFDDLDGPDGRPREARQWLRPGMLSLAQAGTMEFYTWDAERVSSHAYVHFELDDPARLGPPAGWPPTRSFARTPVLGALCAYLLELGGGQSELGRLRSDEIVGLLLDLFVRGPHEPAASQLPAPLAAAVELVGARWDRHGMGIVPVDELAAAAGLSRGHLTRLFRQRFACGPARSLELVRLARAASSLQRSNASVAEVAALCGFANPFHFSRRFAHTYRVPPGQFRATQTEVDPLWRIKQVGLLPVAHRLLSGHPAGHD